MNLKLHFGSVCLIFLGLKIRKCILVGWEVGRDDLLLRKRDVGADDDGLVGVELGQQ